MGAKQEKEVLVTQIEAQGLRMSYESKPFGFALSSSRQTSPEPGNGAENGGAGGAAGGGGAAPRRTVSLTQSHSSSHGLGAAGYHASTMPDLSSFFAQSGKSGSVGSPYGSHNTPPGSSGLTPGGTSGGSAALYASFMNGTPPQGPGQPPRSPYNPYMQSILSRGVPPQQQHFAQPGVLQGFQQPYYTQPIVPLSNDAMQVEPIAQVAEASKQDSPMEDDEDEEDEEEDDSGDGGEGSDFAGDDGPARKRRRSGVRAGNNKKSKANDEGTSSSQPNKKAKPKQKDGSAEAESKSNNRSTRGSKACTVCRRLKMRCEPTGNPDDTKCKRCKNGGHDCIFEESQRGRRKNQKADAMARSIKNMENTLETVLKSIAAGNANMIAGMTLGSDGHLVPGATDLLQQLGPQQQQQLQMPQQPPLSSAMQHPMQPADMPQHLQQITQDLTPMSAQIALPPLPLPNAVPDASNSVANSVANGHFASPGTDSSTTHSRLVHTKAEDSYNASPAVRLHTLPEPENTWAPLGLLAEASLENSHSRAKRAEGEAIRDDSETGSVRKNADGEEEKKLGVANDAYFQPGPSHGKAYCAQLLRHCTHPLHACSFRWPIVTHSAVGQEPPIASTDRWCHYYRGSYPSIQFISRTLLNAHRSFPVGGLAYSDERQFSLNFPLHC